MAKMKMNKKGVIENLMPLIISLVGIAVVIAVGFLIVAEIQANDDVVANRNASTGVNETMEALDDIPGWLPIIVITVIGALLLGLVSLFRRK